MIGNSLTRFVYFLLMLLFIACQENASEKDAKSSDFSGVVPHFAKGDSSKLISKEVYKDGEIAKSLFYFSHGELEREIPYDGGEIHGTVTWYYPNGVKAKTIPYTRGKKLGIGRLYDMLGNLEEEIIFKNDTVFKRLNVVDETVRGL